MNKYLIILIFIAGLFSCRKNQDIITTTESEYPVEQYVVASLKGRVVSDRNIPVKDASVVIGEYKRKTDFNGIFYFKDIKVNKAGSAVVVNKSDFAESRKVFYPQLGATSYMKIRLVKSRKTSIINNNDSDKKVGDKSNTITILGNSFIKDGSDYNGDLVLKWSYFAGNSNPIYQYGDPIGFDKHFKLVGLNSFGTLGITIKDTYDNQINIGKDNTIELKLGINPVQSSFYDKVSLWHYDLTKEKWLEKGKATLIRDNGFMYYLAEVSETGYYNFALPFDVEKVKVEIGTKKTPLPFTQTEISSNNNKYRLSLTSNNNGVVSCFIPSKEKSTISILLKDDIVKRDLEVGIDNRIELKKDFISHKVTGTFYNCNEDFLENGYITIFTGKDSIFYFIDEKGVFSETVLTEESEKALAWFASDLDSKINSGIHKTSVNDDTEVEIGEVYLCQEPFALMQYGEETYLLDLTANDKDVFSLTFEKGKAFYEIYSYPFKGEGEYDLNNSTPTIKNNAGERLFIYQNLEYKITIKEYNKPGMIRGGLEAKVRTGFSGTDTTDLKIYYSVFNE